MEIFLLLSKKKQKHLTEVQAAPGFIQLKVVKPSDTRWLSHERCMRAIRKDLPAIIVTLQQLYETSGDAEAFGLSTLLSSFTGVASVMFLSEVLLGKYECCMQKKTADFSRLQVFLQSTVDELKNLKDEKADWCSSTELALVRLQKEFNIEIGRHHSRSRFMTISTVKDYHELAVIPYIDSLIGNINGRFSDKAVKLLVATSIFNPAELPIYDSLSSYGVQQIKELADFYGTEASVTTMVLPTHYNPLLLMTN